MNTFKILAAMILALVVVSSPVAWTIWRGGSVGVLGAGSLAFAAIPLGSAPEQIPLFQGRQPGPLEQFVGLICQFTMLAVVGLWMLSGYVGALWLFLKGYWLELVGCAIVAGGLPCLLPAVVGPIFLVLAFVIPAKNDSIMGHLGRQRSTGGET